MPWNGQPRWINYYKCGALFSNVTPYAFATLHVILPLQQNWKVYQGFLPSTPDYLPLHIPSPAHVRPIPMDLFTSRIPGTSSLTVICVRTSAISVLIASMTWSCCQKHSSAQRTSR